MAPSMPGPTGIVFRDNSDEIAGPELGRQLREAIARATRTRDRDAKVDAVLRAGTAECALGDCGSPLASQAALLTDHLAGIFVNRNRSEDMPEPLLTEVIAALPARVQVTVPEGFAYYGLHPGDFSDAALELAGRSSVAVVGIRTIGVVLSAMATAALNRGEPHASRITVRPTGHPYDRQTHFSAMEESWIEDHKARNSDFLVVDEGPGLSGSSFLSVAEALVSRGVGACRITLLGTREPDVNRLCATNASERWRRFKFKTVGSRVIHRFEGWTSLSGGRWREHFIPQGFAWPVCWPEMERLKFLSPDRETIVKFEGIGQLGNVVRTRAAAIAEGGFGVGAQDAGGGVTAYRIVDGRPMRHSDANRNTIRRIAEYCAFRAMEFGSAKQNPIELKRMTEFNFLQEFGSDAKLPEDAFCSAQPVIPDGRMQPEDWLLAADGRLLKVDASIHGDDHFFPGPTDIAWDLAGAIAEWDLNSHAEEYLTKEFVRLTSDDLSFRLPYYLLAYASFRAAFCRMAESATSHPAEKLRLQRARQFYWRRLVCLDVRLRTAC